MASKKRNKGLIAEKPSTFEAISSGLTTGLMGVGYGVTAMTIGPIVLPLAAAGLTLKATDRLFWVGKGQNARPVVRDGNNPGLYEEGILHSISKLLVQDSLLVENWTSLCHFLGINKNEAERWERQVQTETLSYRGFIQKILTAWVLCAEVGTATIATLYTILKENGFSMIAELLKREFSQKLAVPLLKVPLKQIS